MALPPGPRRSTAAQTLEFFRDQAGFCARGAAEFGELFTARIYFLNPFVILSDPEAIKEVFSGDAETLHAGEGNRILEPVVGLNSVLLLDEKPHLRQRKLMLPSFHGKRMQAYGELMADATRRRIAGWDSGEPVSIHPPMQSVTLEVIIRAVFGINDDARVARMDELLQRMLDLGERVTIMPMLRRNFGPWSRWARFVKARAAVDAMLYEEIAARRAAPDLEERSDVLSLLLQARDEDGSPMTDQELRDELLTLLVAGHETTATSLAWLFERLSRHPEALSRLVAELDAGESEEYLDAVIKESMRTRPVLHFAMRRTTRPYRLRGHELPAGTTIGSCIYLVHNRPDIYPDPEAFRPERFVESPAGTYTWIPFGGGMRRCLGAAFAMYEMKVVVSTILSELELVPTTEPGERRRRRAITWVPAHGGRVGFRPRGSTAGRQAPLAATAA